MHTYSQHEKSKSSFSMLDMPTRFITMKIKETFWGVTVNVWKRSIVGDTREITRVTPKQRFRNHL